MDELLHHCLRELSFDGDLGCDVSRLCDFIAGFYTHNHAHAQTVDDAFYAFVWSVVVQNPTVCIGIIPPGAATEVYIAPQTSAKRKAKAKGEEHVDGPTPTLHILPDAKLRSLNDLKKEYGDKLRIAVDQETSFAAITGSHIRSSKLSPMVYTTLQLITRGRENGISVVDLGRKSGYDQKTCFYLVKQLVELGQIVKVRRGGVGTHFCIHKYFYERNPLWQQIRDEEIQADQDLQKPSRGYQLVAEDEHGEGDNESPSVEFDPIDARHLSSLPLIRARVIKLLKGSKNFMHPCNNMLLTIGFSNPTKTDRRFFQSRIREIVQQGLIEKVIVPNKKKKDLNLTIKCFRLVTSEGSQDDDGDGVIVQPQPVGDEEKDDGVLDDLSGIKTSLTIHKQIVDLLEEAGTTGMTLSELSAALCHFDKRTIELLLTRAERVPPPSHLSDLGIAGLMETHGRERRNRYFTIASYRTLVSQENLDETTARYSDVDLSDVGGFVAIGHSLFYEDEKVLFKYQDEFKDQERARTGGKPRKYPLKNPILPDGTVKQGRPKGSTKKNKLLALEEGDIQPNTKRKRDEGNDADDVDSGRKKSDPTKKRRLNGSSGPPAEIEASTLSGLIVEPSEGAAVVTAYSQVEFATPLDDELTTVQKSHPETRGRPSKKPMAAGGEAGQVSNPKKRGRPPKRKFDVTSDTEAKGRTEIVVPDEGGSVSLPRKRGRPPKQKSVPSIHEQNVDQLERNHGNAHSQTKHDRPSKKELVAHDTESVENLGPGVSPQSSPDGQSQKRARVEGDVQSSLVGTEITAPLPLNDMSIGSAGRSTFISELEVLRSDTRHEGDALNVRHEPHIPPNDHSTSQDEASSCFESLQDFVEHQPKDVEHANADVDTDDRPKQPNLSITVLPLNVTIGSLGLPTRGESPITQQRHNAFIAIDPSLAMGETGDADASGAGASTKLHDIGHDTSSGGNLTSREQPEDQTIVATRPRVNVSNLRRENELLRVIEDLGGLVNYHTKEFLDAHSILIKSMVKSGEPTSAPPDVRLDKRTASTTLTNMENRGRVKTLKTSITTPTGLSRPACIVYLPNITQDKINAFLGDLSCANVTGLPQPIKKIDKRMEYGPDSNQHVTKGKALLRQKAAEARTQREKDWENMVLRVHAEALKGPAAVRVRRVRTRFLQSTSATDVQRWENEIMEAAREPTIPTTKALKAIKRPRLSQQVLPPPLVSVISPEKSTESLIAQQGPSLPRQMASKRKRISKNKDHDQAEEASVETSKKVSLRRHRFLWNREYDELARDASAIIRARCRDGPRLDWGAFEQVFPAVPRNSVRQRLAHIRETAGNEAYLDRLEDRWYDLWLQHRGTALLPDDNPQSVSNFDLVKHIEFLRTHIDKNALRVGFGQPKENAGPNLSASVDQLLNDWDVLESVHVNPEFDFMWSANVEDGREKRLLRHAITTNVDDLSVATCSPSEPQSVAESAVKMTFGTPHESYDSDAAARFLRDLGEQEVSTAATTLINRGILSKTVRDPQKSKPGRTLKISEINQNAIGGSIPRDTFQDAVTLEDISSQEEGSWREWPLLATEGDVAALLQLVSDRKVEFKIDTSQPQMARPSLEWNSKKADDDQIETAIFVQFRDLSCPFQQPSIGDSSPGLGAMVLSNETSFNHGKSVDSGLASCRRESDGLVDCQACIEDEYSKLIIDLNNEDKELALHILTTVRTAAEKGISKNRLLTNTHSSRESIYSLIRRMTDASVPLLFWSGYASVVLVSSLYLQAWTVVTSETPRTRIFPRRWFDIAGVKMNDIWEAALKAVVGVVLFRPGISQAELRWRLRSVYDRQEVQVIICYLQQEAFIKSRRHPRIATPSHNDSGVDDWEEKTTFWFIGDVRHWYQV